MYGIRSLASGGPPKKLGKAEKYIPPELRPQAGALVDLIKWIKSNPYRAARDVAESFGPQADIKGMVDSSQSAMENLREGNIGAGLTDMAYVPANMATLFLPGSASGMRRASEGSGGGPNKYGPDVPGTKPGTARDLAEKMADMAEARGINVIRPSHSKTNFGESSYLRYGKGGWGGEARVSDHAATGRVGEYQFTAYTHGKETEADILNRWEKNLDELVARPPGPVSPTLRETLEARLASPDIRAKERGQIRRQLRHMDKHPELFRDDEAPRRVVGEYGDEFANYGNKIEDVPIDFLVRLRGNELNEDKVLDLMSDIEAHGLHSPISIVVGKTSREAKVAEGNHRVEALRRLGYTKAPSRVTVGHSYSGVRLDDDLIPVDGEYFSANAAPSSVFRSLASERAQEAIRGQADPIEQVAKESYSRQTSAIK